MVTRIGLDLRALDPSFKSHFGRGTGRYASELSSALKSLDQESQGIAVKDLTTNELCAGGFERRLVNCMPLGKITFESQFLFPKRLKRAQVDIAHFLFHGDAPVRTPVPYLLTVLDLIPLKFPELYKADKANWRYKLARKLERTSIQNAHSYFAISEATKRDLVEVFDVAPDRVQVTPLGVGDEFVARNISENLEEELKLNRAKLGFDAKRPVLLYVGGIDPRKNIVFLLEVFNDLLREGGFSGEEGSDKPVLVLVGNLEREREYPKLLKQIKELGLDQDVILTGFVEDDKLVDYYHSASIFLFPSLYEGFGLPVIEAMSCGVPVIAGDNSSMPEITGNAGVLVRDFDYRMWLNEILGILSSQKRQQKLSRDGIVQARKFSWENTAKLTLNGYAKVSSELGFDIGQADVGDIEPKSGKDGKCRLHA